MERLKACRDCGAVYPLEDFPPYSNGRGRRPMCRPCLRIYWAEYRKRRLDNDPELKLRAYQANREYREKYSEGYIKHRLKKREKHRSKYFNNLYYRCGQLVNSTKRRALHKGFEFDLTVDIIFAFIHAQNFKCAVTGTEFDISESRKYHRSPCAPSIDRKDNGKGYTLDNIQIVVAWYNLLKNEWSDDDVKSFIHVAYHTLFKD